MLFYLGTHEESWLRRTATPLFVSHTRLRDRRHLPQARGRWALDSGAFSEVASGGFRTSPAAYTEAVERYREEIGGLDWAAPQDWMCEPHVLAATGLSVQEHQERTVSNYLELRATGLPFIPVLQGWDLTDYVACIDLYQQAGVDLASLPLVGLGSICRRQHTDQIRAIVAGVAVCGIRLHGFGVKLQGLSAYADLLASADSLAWSYHARKNPGLDGCRHQSCANCLPYAEQWRQRVLANLDGVRPRPHALAMC